MRLKGPIIKPRRVTPREFSDHVYELRRPLTLGVLALLLVILGWWGYRAVQANREEAAQVILTDALQMLLKAPEPTQTGETTQERPSAPEQALPLFNRILEEYPGSSAAEQALLHMGHTLYGLGTYQEALAAYQQYLEKYPNGSWVFFAALGKAYAMEAERDYTHAASIFRSLADRYRGHSSRVEALIGLARCLQGAHQTEEAVSVYRQIVNEYPGTSWSSQAEQRLALLER